jgi:predicted nucleic acid-binding protein
MIFIDTGAFLARYLSNDQYHDQSNEMWDAIRRRRETCFTTNFVLNEVFTLLGRRAGNKFAADRALNIYASRVIKIMRPDRKAEVKAIDTFEKYADQKVTFTDCISFVLMKQEGIKRAFSFDFHFRLAGYDVVP